MGGILGMARRERIQHDKSHTAISRVLQANKFYYLLLGHLNEMKRSFSHMAYLSGALALAALQACQENGPIQLYEDEMSSPVEVSLLKRPDTTVVSETIVDITGLTQQDEEDYPGTVLVTGIKTDLGRERNALAYARILLEDRNAPFPITAGEGKVRLTTYPRLDIGKAKLDNAEFDMAEWIIQIRSVALIPVRTGVFYKLLNDGSQNIKQFVYEPRHTYSIEAEGKEAIAPFELEVSSPDEITLVEPKPLAFIFRDEDFVLRWEGASSEVVRIVLSTYDEKIGRAATPLMLIKASPHAHSLLLPSKLLKLIPSTPNGRYMLSVISANRQKMTIGGYPNKVLVQGAFIHNTVVNLR